MALSARTWLVGEWRTGSVGPLLERPPALPGGPPVPGALRGGGQRDGEASIVPGRGGPREGFPGAPSGTGRRGPAGEGRGGGPGARARRAAGPGARLRGLPHRPARRRGRPAAAPAGASCPGTRWSAGSSRSGPRVTRLRRRATGSASPGCARTCGGAATAGAAPRTSARARATPAGTPTAATPSTRPCRRTSPTGCPTATPTRELAPLLCAGIIGYRALRRAELPPGGRLGIYGFGASAHLAAQVALAAGRHACTC